MQAWLPVILVWFVSLFSSTFALITCIYRYLNHRKYRQGNVHKYLPPWVLLAILTAAFMVGNVWLLVSSRESDINRMKRNGWVFIGVFVGSFLVICIIIAISWNKYQTRASKRRISGKAELVKRVESIGTPSNVVQSNSQLVMAVDTHQTLEKTRSHKLESNFHPKRNQNNETLVLRNLSNPNEEYCIDLSNSGAPVVKRKSAILSEDFVQETALPRSKMLSLEIEDGQDGVPLDYEC